MHTAALSRVLLVGGMGMALTAAAQTNSWYAKMLTPPDIELRSFYSGSAPPASPKSDPPPVVIRVAEKSDNARPASINGELVYQNVPPTYYEDCRYYQLFPPPPTPVERCLTAVFEPEEFKIGRTATLSCSLLTAIKRRDPLCLLNPIFFDISW